MALISDRAAGREDGGYTRVLGDARLGALISRVQATTISAGSELERIIADHHPNKMDAIQLGQLLNGRLPDSVYLMTKQLIKKHLKSIIQSTSEPDFLLIMAKTKRIYVIELKDGDVFDTKKSAGEVRSCRTFASLLESHLLKCEQDYQAEIRICCFNQSSKQAIVEGFKHAIKLSEAMTGAEFCTLAGLSYESIQDSRRQDQIMNLEFFVDELLKIPAVVSRLHERL